MSERYLIHTKSNGTIAAELNLETPTAQVVGQTDRFTFYLPSNFGDKTFLSDYTIQSGTVEEYDSITIPTGVTVTVFGVLQANTASVDGDLITKDDGVSIFFDGDARSNLLKYSEWSSKYETNKMLDGTLKYTDRTGVNGVESLVVGIEPVSDLQNKNVKGVWGLIDAVQDERGPTLSTNRITLSITNLAEYENYANHSQVEVDLQL